MYIIERTEKFFIRFTIFPSCSATRRRCLFFGSDRQRWLVVSTSAAYPLPRSTTGSSLSAYFVDHLLLFITNYCARLPLAEADYPAFETGSLGVSETLPKVLEMFPEVLEMFPEVLETFPEVLEMFPEVLEMFPKVLEMFPEVLETSPGSAVTTVSGAVW
jgi:hypothetical protein